MKPIRLKILHGAFWNTFSQYGSQLINVAAMVVLARILGPGDFGVVAMATMVIALVAVISAAGLGSALIQKPDVSDEDRSAAFWGQAMVCFAAALLTFAAAPLVSLLFRDAKLLPVTQWLAMLLLFIPINSIPESLETKKMKYDLIAVSDLVSVLVASAVAVWMALRGMGLWSLVVLEVVKRALRGLLLLRLTGWFPAFALNGRALRALMDSGRAFTLKNLIFYASEFADSFLIGRLIGPAALGTYNLGYQIASLPVTKTYNTIGPMLFPAFSLMERDLSRIKANLLRVSWLGGYFLIPFLFMLAFGADAIVDLVFGPKWAAAVPIVRIFCLEMAVTAVSFGEGSLLMALGRVPVINTAKAVFTVAMIVTGIIGIRVAGLTGLTLSYVLCSILHMAAIKAVTFKAIGLRWAEFFGVLRAVWVVTAASLAVHWAYASLFGGLSPLYFIAGQIGLTVALIAPFALKVRLVDFKRRKLDLERIVEFRP